MTFDEISKQALSETVDERVEQMLSVTPKPGFSISYRLWERKALKNLCRNSYDSRWTLHRARRIVTTFIVAGAIVLTLTAGAVVGLSIGRFSFDDKREYSELFMSGLSSDKSCIEEYYGLPEEDGWITDYFYSDEYGTSIVYTRQNEIVSFSQNLIRGNMGNINTENAIIEPISIYEENDGFFIEYQSGENGLYWTYDGYLFNLIGNIDRNKMMNLAYSTKIIKF